MDPFLDYSKKRALWTNEIEQALAAYEQMVKTGLANLQAKKKEKEEQKKPEVYDVTKDKTVAAQVEQINQQAKPLPPGETPVLSEVRVVVGDTVNLTNTIVRDAYGNETADPFTGTIRPVAYIPLDQGKNIMPEASGNGIQEIIQRNGGTPERIPNEGLKEAPPGGVFFDMQLIAQGQPKMTVTQHVYVAQLYRTGGVRSAFVVGQNRINLTAMSPGQPGSVSVTVGPIRRQTGQ